MLTAEQLGIPEAWRAALALVLEKLESGELKKTEADAADAVPLGNWFNMNWWGTIPRRNCGTVRCIGGWAEALGGINFTSELDAFEIEHPQLEALFYPDTDKLLELRRRRSGRAAVARHIVYDTITAAEAARALRGYLEAGVTDWEAACADRG